MNAFKVNIYHTNRSIAKAKFMHKMQQATIIINKNVSVFHLVYLQLSSELGPQSLACCFQRLAESLV
ncbi:hypothetical protein PJN27_28695, partial [Mycobacterium kansasii]